MKKVLFGIMVSAVVTTTSSASPAFFSQIEPSTVTSLASQAVSLDNIILPLDEFSATITAARNEVAGRPENFAAIKQTGFANIVGLQQSGTANYGLIVQDGSGNSAKLAQHGGNNTGLISQIGHSNSVSLTQVGTNHAAMVTQQGRGNVAIIAQR